MELFNSSALNMELCNSYAHIINLKLSNSNVHVINLELSNSSALNMEEDSREKKNESLLFVLVANL